MSRFLLMGGLGNQLFQLAAGLSYCDKTTILVDNLGNPRRSKSGQPEIASFTLPESVKIESANQSTYIARKYINFGIRLGARTPARNITITIYEKLVSVTSVLYSKKYFGVNLSAGTGNDPKFKVSQRRINIGYFQSQDYCETDIVFKKMMNLRIAKPSRQFLALQEIAKKEKPIVVHIRLGDYLTEESFGVPSITYYRQGIEFLIGSRPKTAIWLFSNDPDEAIKKIPESYLDRVFLVPPDGLSSAETLELMRNGCAYVIANSTFSWWGAMLSYSTDSEVVIPTPWFKSSIAPNTIYPKSWTKISADYENFEAKAWSN